MNALNATELSLKMVSVINFMFVYFATIRK